MHIKINTLTTLANCHHANCHHVREGLNNRLSKATFQKAKASQELAQVTARRQALLAKALLLVSELPVLEMTLNAMADGIKREKKALSQLKLEYGLASVRLRLKQDSPARIVLLEAAVAQYQQEEILLAQQIDVVLQHQASLETPPVWVIEKMSDQPQTQTPLAALVQYPNKPNRLHPGKVLTANRLTHFSVDSQLAWPEQWTSGPPQPTEWVLPACG